MNEPLAIQTKNLTKCYGQFTALDDLTIQIERGRILGFIGPNGAGKTTTIKILVGLSKPTSGSAMIAGVDCVRQARKIKHMVGYMPDIFGTYDNMRVHEYLDFFAAAYKVPRKIRKKRLPEIMELTGTDYMRDLFVESLSHGMKQRVGIARTLVHDPQVLILDEPANGLDPTARIEMRRILLQLAQMGKTLIVTSHILPELSRICDMVAIITHGKLRAFGDLEDIMKTVRQHRTMEVQLVSSSQVQAAAELLEKLLGEDASVIPSPQEAMVRFETDMDDHEMPKLLVRLLSQKLQVAQFREVVQDLEDAFLTVTQDSSASAVGS
jgi:ABC-2 type transport system ATP-binding protein